MKKINFKILLPHIIAIGIFLIVAVIFCKPALESGVAMKQSDMTGWHGMSHQSFEYKEQHGHFPLWLTNMFSGMPAFQVAIEGAWNPLIYIDRMIQLWLPQPINFFFLACIGFYFFCICLKIRPYAAILGSLAFAYCSFSPIIVTAGHVTQMLALGYAPAVLGAAILVYEKKYFTGFTLMALLTALQIQQGHQQISYYLFLVLGGMSIAYVIHFIKTKQSNHLLKSLGLLVVAGIIGIAVNAINLFTVYDFAKESKRGGQLVINNEKNESVSNGKTTGLSREYAFQWSYGKAETFSLLFPGVLSYGSHYAERDGENYLFPKLDETSNTSKFLVEKLNIPEESANNFALSKSMDLYWGDQPFTNGPIYLGAVVCFLFIFGMFYLDSQHKWWILAMVLLAILMSWGKNLPGFNYFLFDHFPFYNKFRVPTMILVIPQLLVPVIASLTINKLISGKNPETWKKFRSGLFATGSIFLLAIFFYLSSDFSRENKQRTIQFNQLYNSSDPAIENKMAVLNNSHRPEKDNQLYEEMIFTFKGSPDAQKNAREFVTAIRKDRAAILMADIIRSLIFVLITVAIVALYIKNKINATVLIIGVTLTALIDLLGFGMKYLNEKSFDTKEKYEENEFPLSAASRSILADKDPNFRVFNLAGGDPFQESKTSYYHKSIGGYHPAKLGIYDDLSAHQLSGQPNVSVLNMLNTKYIFQQQGNDVIASLNPGALGNAWFVKAVKYVNGPLEEMNALTSFNPKDTLIADEKYKSLIGSFSPADSTSIITMKTFDNDRITYESFCSADNIAVFSEIYYKDWRATIDGKPVDFFKANYVLRALKVPPGKHVVEFKFEPKIFFIGKTVSNISAWLIVILLAGFIVYTLKNENKKELI